MALPQTYVIPGPASIASYNWFDISQGLGYVNYYGYTSDTPTASGALYSLTTNSDVYSSTIESRKTSGLSTADQYMELTFDAPSFAQPKIIKGSAILTLSHSSVLTSSSSADYIQAALQKWDGTTATNISIVSGAASTTTGLVRENTSTLLIPIPRTGIGVGESIRLNIKKILTTGSSTEFFAIAHDPKDRDGNYITPSTDTTSTTKLILSVPFEIGD
jgi:hypothetical protein